MIYALQRVKQELRAEIEQYGIMVSPENHAVGWDQGVTHLEPYTPARKCRAVVKLYIKRAKEAEQRKADENQAKLL